MARPVKHTVESFNHPVISGKKMFIVQRNFGNDGYATWYKILELLGQSNNHFIDLSDDEKLLYVSSYCGVDIEKLIQIIDLIVSLRKFDQFLWSHKIIFCKDFVRSIKRTYSRRSNSCITYYALISMLHEVERITDQKPATQKQDPIEPKKPAPKKEAENKEEKEDLFLKWWGKYKKNVGKEKTLKLWNKLKIEEMHKCLEVVDDYVSSTPDIKFRKHPQTYIGNKSFNDEIIHTNKPVNHVNNGDGIDWDLEAIKNR